MGIFAVRKRTAKLQIYFTRYTATQFKGVSQMALDPTTNKNNKIAMQSITPKVGRLHKM